MLRMKPVVFVIGQPRYINVSILMNKDIYKYFFFMPLTNTRLLLSDSWIPVPHACLVLVGLSIMPKSNRKMLA
jgi:RAB protein geranylgeranyltransferase component A